MNESSNSREAFGIHDNALGGSLLAINVFIILLNLLAIIVIWRLKHKKAIDIYVLALALSDFCKGLVPVPITVYIYLSEWHLINDSDLCNFYGWIAFTTNSGSMLILTFMAFERYLAIVKPFTHRNYVTEKNVNLSVLTAFAFTGLHSALPLLGLGRIVSYFKGAYCHFDYSNHSSGTIAYSLFIVVYGFSMNIVVLISYVIVFYKIRNLIQRHRKMANKIKRKAKWNLKTEKMFSYLTVVLMVIFSFTWLPFLIVVLSALLGAKNQLEKLDLFAMRVAVLNSMLNPIAYATLCKPYRNGVVSLFRKCCAKKGYINPEEKDPWTRIDSVTRKRNVRTETISSLSEDLTPDAEKFGATNRSRLPSELEENEKQRLMSKKREKLIKFQEELKKVTEDSESTPTLLRSYGKETKMANDSDSSVTAVSLSTCEEESEHHGSFTRNNKSYKKNISKQQMQSNENITQSVHLTLNKLECVSTHEENKLLGKSFLKETAVTNDESTMTLDNNKKIIESNKYNVKYNSKKKKDVKVEIKSNGEESLSTKKIRCRTTKEVKEEHINENFRKFKISNIEKERKEKKSFEKKSYSENKRFEYFIKKHTKSFQKSNDENVRTLSISKVFDT
ncbi:melanopsin isoform X3 [Hydra vulgaris]|uniref:Melanopsin isoform X3 n=1 Tax=Hydra vulgaris TaxID=6087 RepID=A0ABM4CVW1_HYDVU